MTNSHRKQICEIDLTIVIMLQHKVDGSPVRLDLHIVHR